MKINETNLAFKGAMADRKNTSRIILHHAEATSCTPQQIHQWHLANGWSGAGYHFLVRKDGTIWRLRPEGKVGAHASGANSDSVGVCFEGRYQTETMPQKQIDAGRELVAHLKAKYGVAKVLRHKDVGSTDCPGKNFPFESIAKEAASKPAAAAKPAYSPGRYTTVVEKLNVRTKPKTGSDSKILKKSQLTANAQKHAHSDGTLKKGTAMDVSATCVDAGGNTWGRIPSGYVCMKYKGKSRVKKG